MNPAAKKIPLSVVPVAADSLYAAQQKVYPREISGRFANLRLLVVFVLLGIFYALPWLGWDGHQAVLFDLPARKFHIFGLTFWPQDFFWLTWLLIIAALSLFFFTALAGRLWCGYACPQTVWTEVFLWIERLCEGTRNQRMKLDAGPWSRDKLLRKGAKQSLWVILSLWTGFTFVGFFTPVVELGHEVMNASLSGWELFWIVFYGFATYGNAGFLREQVCKYMCPYARFQSAMFDHDTMIVSYDTARGDPRGTRARGADLKTLGLGDCIDCGLCVHVCPVGIDIRDGLQYECIACTACIDACDSVMDKMKYPRGLIRYATQNGLAKRLSRAAMFRHVLRPRVLIYGSVLVAIALAFTFALTTRSPFKVDVVRDRSTLARLADRGWIENVYRLQLMNATERAQRLRVAVQGIPGATLAGAAEVEVLPAQARWVTVAVQVPPASAQALGPGAHPIRFQVAAAGDASGGVTEKSTFVVPR